MPEPCVDLNERLDPQPRTPPRAGSRPAARDRRAGRRPRPQERCKRLRSGTQPNRGPSMSMSGSGRSKPSSTRATTASASRCTSETARDRRAARTSGRPRCARRWRPRAGSRATPRRTNSPDWPTPTGWRSTHPTSICFIRGRSPTEEAIALALETETAARDHDARITNSDGASVSRQDGDYVYGNSHGFLEGYSSSRNSLSCVVIAEDSSGMQTRLLVLVGPRPRRTRGRTAGRPDRCPAHDPPARSAQARHPQRPGALRGRHRTRRHRAISSPPSAARTSTARRASSSIGSANASWAEHVRSTSSPTCGARSPAPRSTEKAWRRHLVI